MTDAVAGRTAPLARRTARELVAIHIYVQPVATAAMAMALLGERLNPRVVIAGAMILARIGLVIWSPRSKRPTTVA